MALTVEQKIAQKEQELAKLKEQARKLETGQKIVIGGMMLSLAKKDARLARDLLTKIKDNVTSDSDLKRLQPIITELQKQVNKSSQPQQQPQH